MVANRASAVTLSNENSPERKIRILHVINTLVVGGAENYVVNLTNATDSSKFDVYIAYSDGKSMGLDGAALVERLRARHGLIKIPLRKFGNWWNLYSWFCNVRLVYVLYEIIRHHKIDIVHTHLMHSALWAHLAAKCARVPVIYGLMGVLSPRDPFSWGAVRNPAAGRMLDGLVTKYIAFSKYLQVELETKLRVDKQKIVLTYLGVDLGVFNPTQDGFQIRRQLNLSTSVPVVGVVARLSAEKGVHKAILAFVHVVAQLPDAVLLIVGDGPLRKKLGDMCAEFNIANNVIFTGFRDDVPGLMATIDLYLQVGDLPNIGTTTLEAMASAKPLITAVGNEDGRAMASETLIDGENGFIVSNVPEEIAARIVCLLREKNNSFKMGQRSRKIVEEKFDFKGHVAVVEALYERLTNSP